MKVHLVGAAAVAAALAWLGVPVWLAIIAALAAALAMALSNVIEATGRRMNGRGKS